MSHTIDYTDVVDQAFSLDELATLLTWSAGEALGLGVSVAFDQEGEREVVEVIRRDPREALYVLEPTIYGTVMLARAYVGKCELDTVEEALGRVLELENWTVPVSSMRLAHRTHCVVPYLSVLA